MSAPAIPYRFRDKLASLTRREKIFLASGGAAAVALFLYILAPAPADEGGVELASPAAAAATPSPPPPAVSALQVPAAAAPSVEGVVLRGVMGGGPRGGAAIFLLPTGQERVVRVGRDLLPGLTLKEIGVAHSILASGSDDIRLAMNRSGANAPAGPATAPARGVANAAAGGVGRETLEYRLGLEPRKESGRIKGFAMRPGATLPLLQKAGLRPGDVLVAVNGQPFESEEKVLELSSEIAGSYTAEFEFLRGGRRMKANLDVNPRPQ